MATRDPTQTRLLRQAAYKQLRAALREFRAGVNARWGQADIYTYIDGLESVLSVDQLGELIDTSLGKATAFVRSVFTDFRGFISGASGLRSDILGRTYGFMKAHTQTLVANIRANVSDWLSGRINKRTAFKNITKAFRQTITKGKRVLRTEIVKAYNQAVIAETALLGEQFGFTPKVQWVTRRDSKVRATHRARDKRKYTLDKAQTLIGEPNCRCSLVPVASKKQANRVNAIT